MIATLRPLHLALVLCLVTACGSSQTEQTFSDPDDPACAASQDRGENDPRVSTSQGEPGGFVVKSARRGP